MTITRETMVSCGDCINSSGDPYGECLESFHFEEAISGAAPLIVHLTSNDEIRTAAAAAAAEEEDGIVEEGGGGGGDVDPASINASNTERQNRGDKPVQTGEVSNVEHRVLKEIRNVDPMCVNASNPYHRCTEHCSQRTPEARKGTVGGKSAVLKGERSKEKSWVVGGGKNVDPMCVNASNPYHQCTVYCSQRTPEARRRSEGGNSGRKLLLPHRFKAYFVVTKVQNLMSSKEEDRMVGGGRNVDPMCVNASNPFHRCTVHCSQRTPEAKRRPEEGKSVGNGERNKEESRVAEGGRKVDPTCVNASNPYHTCAGYCSLRTPEARRRTEEGKSEESRGAVKKVERRAVNPKCINSSNPYHKCTDLCLQRTHKVM